VSYKFEETPVNHTKQANEHNSLIMWGLAIGTLFTIFVGTLRWLRDLPSKSEESVSKVPNEGEPLISSNKAQAINGRDIDQRSPSIQKGEIMKSPSDEKQSARGTPLSTDMQHDPNQSNTRFTSATKYIVGIGIFLTFLFILFISRNVLSLLIIATLIAFIIQPLISFFQNKFKVSRGISVGLTYQK